MKYAAGALILGLVLASCSGADKKNSAQTQTEPAKPMKESKRVSTVAVVEAIDPETRKISLRDSKGKLSTFTIDESVKNLEQVRVGDLVAVDYFESLAIEVVKPGDAVNENDYVVHTAEPGQLPARVQTRQVTRTMTIEKIDRSVPSITLRDSDGTLSTFRVRHPERLDQVKVGDTLRITYAQALAVSVKRASASKEAK